MGIKRLTCILNLSLTIFFIFQSAHATNTRQQNVRVYFNHKDGVKYNDPYRPNFIRHGDNLEQVLIDAVMRATSSVYIAVYDFDLPLLAKALADAKNINNIDVRIVIDNNVIKVHQYATLGIPNELKQKISQNEDLIKRITALKNAIDINRDGKHSTQEKMERDALYILKNARVPFITDENDNTKGSGLMHHKFMLVDNDEVIVSTSNYTWSCIHGDVADKSSIGNANSMIQLQSPELNKYLGEEFKLMWGNNGKMGTSIFGLKKPSRPVKTMRFRGSRLDLAFSPNNIRAPKENRPLTMVDNVIKNSKQSSEIALFVLSDQNIANTLERKHNSNRNYTIKAVGDKNFFTRYYSDFLDMLGVELANSETCKISEGNRPWENPIRYAGLTMAGKGDKFHHKFALIDNKTVIFGSSNWSSAADLNNDEFILVFNDAYIASEFRKGLDNIYKRTKWGLSESQLQKIKSVNKACEKKLRSNR